MVLTALISWTFDLYAPYIETSIGNTVASESALANTSASDRDARFV